MTVLNDKSRFIKKASLVAFCISILYFSSVFAQKSSGSSKSSSSSSSSGSSGPSFALTFHLDFAAAYGYSQAQTTGENSAKADLTQAELASTLGILVTDSFFVGANFEYRLMNQFSEVAASLGSMEGKRSFIAPVLGAQFSEWLVKLSFQSSGDYIFSKLSANGASLQYAQPSGYQLSVNYAYAPPFYLGVLLESLEFGKLIRSDESSPVVEKLSFTKLSGVVTWVY